MMRELEIDGAGKRIVKFATYPGISTGRFLHKIP